MQFPINIEQAVAIAALNLGKALDFLEWPNGERDAPPHEVNALVNLQVCLAGLDPPYHSYFEGSISQRGRVDLMASNGVTSLAIEAKRFGAINERSDSVMRDLVRLRNFEPAYYRGSGAREINEWWTKSLQRWGVIIITSFRGHEVKDAWVTTEEAVAREKMELYKRKADRPQMNGNGFMALWSTKDMYRFAAPITLSERWSDTGSGYLLCGAVPLGSDI